MIVYSIHIIVNHDNFIVVLFCGVKVSFCRTGSQKYANRYFNIHIIFTKLWHIGIWRSSMCRLCVYIIVIVTLYIYMYIVYVDVNNKYVLDQKRNSTLVCKNTIIILCCYITACRLLYYS